MVLQWLLSACIHPWLQISDKCMQRACMSTWSGKAKRSSCHHTLHVFGHAASSLLLSAESFPQSHPEEQAGLNVYPR